MISSWVISNKVSIIITDNAPNITKAVKVEMKKKHFGCFAHKLNLCVKNSLGIKDNPEEKNNSDECVNDKSVKITIQKIKTIVNHMKKVHRQMRNYQILKLY